MRKDFRRISLKAISLILTVIMVFSVMPVNMGILLKTEATVTRDGEERTVVVASSDYQFPNSGSNLIYSQYTQVIGNLSDDAGSHAVVENILGKMAADGVTEADGVLHCGDFDYDLPAQGTHGIESYRDAISSVIDPDDPDHVVIMGNHDQTPNAYFASTGNNDPASGKYGVFAINEDDFPWQNSINATAENTVKETAQNLRNYLNNKLSVGYTAPIFVISHIPLFYTTRTLKQTCGYWAGYIVDVLNDAAAHGLNIVYLFGHDHSQSFDDYVGGPQIFFAPGDTMNVPRPGATNGYVATELGFVCMNAGYTGYYEDYGHSGTSLNSTPSIDLTMSEFEIGEEDMIINRYSLLDADSVKDGKTTLSVAGRTGKQYASDESAHGLTPRTEVYDSGYVLDLTGEVDTSYEIPAVVVETEEGDEEEIAEIKTYQRIYSLSEVTSTDEVIFIMTDKTYAGTSHTNYGILDNRSGGDAYVGPELMDSGLSSFSDTITGPYSIYEWNMIKQGTTGTKYKLKALNGESEGLYLKGVRRGDIGKTSDKDNCDFIFDATGAAITFTDNGDNFSLRDTNVTRGYFRKSSREPYIYGYNEGNAPVAIYKAIETPHVEEWVPAHEVTETTPIVTTYSLPGNGKYALVGANGILEAASTGTSQNGAVTGKPSGAQTIWELTNESGGYTLKTTVNGTLYYLKNDGSVSTSKQYVTLSADASNKVTIGSMGGFTFYPATVTEKPGSGTYVYTLDKDGIDANTDYLIVAGGNEYALTHNGTTVSRTSVSINTKNNTITTNTDAYEWQFSGTSSGNIFDPNSDSDYYLGNSTGTVKINTSATTYNFAATSLTNGRYRIVNPAKVSSKYYYLRYSSSSWNMANASNTSSTSYYVRLYKLTSEDVQPGETTYSYSNAWTTTPHTTGGETTTYTDQWAMLSVNGEIEVAVGASTAAVKNAIVASDNIEAFISTSASGTPSETLDKNLLSFDWSQADLNEKGSYIVPVSINGHKLGEVVVKVTAGVVDTITLDSLEGTVKEGASKNTRTGANIVVTYTDGTQVLIPVTVGMLVDYFGEQNCVKLCTEEGDYEKLGVNYKNKAWFDNFTLHVTPPDDYPEYPNEGSVKVDKSAVGVDFATTGVAKVELTATGVPMNPGIDLVIVLDTSSSMGDDAYIGTYNGEFVSYSRGDQHWYYIDGTDTGLSGSTNSNVVQTGKRIDVLKESLSDLLVSLGQVGENGQVRDIDVAICDFNGMTHIDGDKNHMADSGYNNSTPYGQVYTGTKNLTAGAFVNIGDLQKFDTSQIGYHSGTNYDHGLQQAYELIKAKQEDNGGDERDLYVIFMSDGCPFQYNYMGSNNGSTTWNDVLQGNYTSAEIKTKLANSTYSYFYNPDGNKLWMAEALKGDPEQEYFIINPQNAAGSVDVTGDNVNDPYMEKVNGFGAKMYSIGFCLAPDGKATFETMNHVVQAIATSDEYYYLANSADSLDNAFRLINEDIKVAASEAYFVDQMGTAYDIQMAKNYTKNGISYSLETAPTIEVIEHTVYTLADYNKGLCEYDDIGTRRTGMDKSLEIVSFSTDGTKAYSNLDDPAVDLIRTVDGKQYIDAHTFIYNLDKENAVGVDIDGDGTADYDLPPETFYWKIGIIADKEYSLHYYVYLTGSMEGTRAAGSYPTNNYAELYYINYIDHSCSVKAPEPKLPWEAATISYEFYLVNTNGEPVNSEGTVVPFANRVLVGNRQTKEVLLNTGDTVSAFVAAELELPEGYSLYNDFAEFRVTINSGSTQSHAVIDDEVPIETSTNGSVTTYYYGENATYHKNGEVPNVSDYGNTHVAFGVLLIPSLIPDAVVIDYGLPVNISVLSNDLYIASGTEIRAIAAAVTDGTVLNKQEYDASRMTGAKELTLANGTATVIGGTVRYTPTSAKMQTEETFYYEVVLGGKYYYSTVTVYPAQNIYYEDSFFTFEGDWETVGETYADKYQAEDRPGEFNLSKIDFNNVYGYDQAYEDTSITYSLGSARKATVAPGSTVPTAEFTFAGTGFDLFGVTSSATGAMFVEVYDSTNKRVKNYFVNTYYGYTYDETEDKFVVAANSEDGLFQVPVIRSRDLPYGVYKVKVIPRYAAGFDKTGNGEYDIYVDGIRIYDPAGKTEKLTDSIANAYDADKEYNDVYVELRSNIISEASFYKLSDKDILADYTPGAMYIDGIAALNSGDEKDAYGKFSEAGPNNELYLSKGQAVAFYLQIDKCEQAPESVQLGMKVVGGGNAGGSLLVMNSAQEKPFTVAVNGAAARYKDVSDAITWDPALVAGSTITGLKTADASAFVKSPTGDMSDYEWTLTKSGDNWMLGNGTSNIALTATADTGVSASFAPGGTGDTFTITGENGIFTFTDTSKGLYLYSVNREAETSGSDTVETVSLITGSSISENSFAIYRKGKVTNDAGEEVDGYVMIDNAEDLIAGGGYVIVALGNGGKFVCPESKTVTNEAGIYRTLYPIVVVNNSDNIISLTNFKFAFERKEDSPEEPVALLMSAPPARRLAMSAIRDFVLTDYVEDPEVDTSGITVEWADDDLDFGDVATVYIRTPADIAAVTVDDVNVTDVSDNGDGTKTWTYTFTVEQNSDGTYDIVFMDANGTVCKTLTTSELELPEVTEPSTQTPDESEPATQTPDEPDDGEGEGGRNGGWLRRLLDRIIEFFKKLVRWWKNLI